MATRPVGTCRRRASSSVATRTVSIQTSGRSGLRLPAARPGNSTRSTAMPWPVAAWSIATRAGWSRPALAPGVSTSPAGADAFTGPSCRTRRTRSPRRPRTHAGGGATVDACPLRPRIGSIGSRKSSVRPAHPDSSAPTHGWWMPADAASSPRSGPVVSTRPMGCCASARCPVLPRCPRWSSPRRTSSSRLPSTRRHEPRSTKSCWAEHSPCCTRHPFPIGAAGRRGSGPVPSIPRPGPMASTSTAPG